MDLQRQLHAEMEAEWQDEHEALHEAQEELRDAELIEEAERAHLAGEKNMAAHQGFHLDC